MQILNVKAFQDIFKSSWSYDECAKAFLAAGHGMIPFGEYCLMLGVAYYSEASGLSRKDCVAALYKMAAPSQGLGDTVAKITKAFGVQPCGGCNQRKEALNNLFPYGSK